MAEKTEQRAKRARKRQRNLVAKHARSYNKSTVQRDRTKHHRDKYPAISLQESLEWTQRDV